MPIEWDADRRRRRHRSVTLSLLPVLLIAAACGTGSDEAGTSDGPRVVATTGVLADIARSVAGADANVVQLIGDGVDVHGFSLSARDRQGLEDAALLVENGAGLEAGVPLDDIGTATWTLADEGIAEGRPSNEGLPAAGAADSVGDAEPEPNDPHVWMDPTFVASAAPSLAAALAAVDPDNEERYRKRAADYADQLERLDQEINDELASIADERRTLVTSHDSLGYFADRYGLTILATPFPASGPEAEPSAARLADVAEAITEAGVPAVFAQTSDGTDVLETLARETGVAVVDQLLVASPGDAGSYEEMLRRDAMLISAALR